MLVCAGLSGRGTLLQEPQEPAGPVPALQLVG